MPNPAKLGHTQGADGVLKRVNSVIPQMKGRGGVSELQIGMMSDFASYDASRVRWSKLWIPNGLAPRRRLSVIGRGHAVAPVIRSIPGSDLQAPFEFFSLLFDVSYGGRI